MADLKNIENKLMFLNDTVTKSTVELNKHKGQLEQINKQLKKDYGVETLAEAEALFVKKEKEVTKLELELEKGVTELEKKYDDNK